MIMLHEVLIPASTLLQVKYYNVFGAATRTVPAQAHTSTAAVAPFRA